MFKDIIIVVLLILLMAFVGVGFYLYRINPTFYQIPNNDRIESLEGQNQWLGEKVEKSTAYAAALDLIMEPTRQQIDLATKKDITNAEWLSQMSAATDFTGDSILKGIFQKFTTSSVPKDASDAVMEYTDYTIKAVLENLRLMGTE